jgi:hypothetical protein
MALRDAFLLEARSLPAALLGRRGDRGGSRDVAQPELDRAPPEPGDSEDLFCSRWSWAAFERRSAGLAQRLLDQLRATNRGMDHARVFDLLSRARVEVWPNGIMGGGGYGLDGQLRRGPQTVYVELPGAALDLGVEQAEWRWTPDAGWR